MTNPLAQFDVSRDEIARVVARFYARVRRDPVLGPVFAAHVRDWPAHEEKIARFWANAILRERVYDGNPMQVHKAAQDVQPEHFAVWLDLFDEVLAEELNEETARRWSALAHRIGRGFKVGLEMRAPPGSVPKLR
ncbi:group III truncated hemoglobin [Roseovarius aquimarinus]|uniref:Group III truncated hemoglobin n=1 Tax=Roseovarius aquimarinus TaxID=1229156 RepID=A0ABW7I9Y4_9RHOB